MNNITYSMIHSIDALRQVVKLQESVWSQETISSLAHMAAALQHGGMVIGAYDGKELIGFCYGFVGVQNTSPYLVSHMMAIDSRYRDRGIGYELKKQQKAWAFERGFTKIVWTFDPLESRNAYLNLRKLGGVVRTYIEAFYGELTGNLNQGLPTDRFLLEWELMSPRVRIENDTSKNASTTDEQKVLRETVNSGALDSVLEVSTLNIGPILLPVPTHEHGIPDASSSFLLPIPAQIHEIKKYDLELAKQWRYGIRRISQDAFAKGFQVMDFQRTPGPIAYYVFVK